MTDPSDGPGNREHMLAGDPYIPEDPDNDRRHLARTSCSASSRRNASIGIDRVGCIGGPGACIGGPGEWVMVLSSARVVSQDGATLLRWKRICSERLRNRY
jgi:hypothetical protein